MVVQGSGETMADDRTLPFLALRPLDLRLPSASPPKKLAIQIEAFRFVKPPMGIGTRPCPDAVEHYEIKDPKQAYWRVLIENRTPGDRTASVVGQTGHLERANAWTHLIAAAMFAIYALIRPWVFDMHSFTAQLSGIAVVMSALTFAVSVTYHVYSPVRGCAPIMRNFDHLAIYATMATAAVADTSLVTRDFVGVPFQTIADPLLAATVAGGYFTIRRIMVPPDETRDFMFKEACSLGLFRIFHSDLEHAPLRRVASGSLAFVWIMMVPPAFNNLTVEAAGVWLGGVLTASVLLMMGVILDAFYGPDKAFASGETDYLQCTCAQSKKYGFIMTSHAWWHVISVAGTVLAVVAREFGVSQIF